MHDISALFAVSAVMLVPFLYVASFVPDACATPREEGWGSTSCSLSSDEKYKSCCWHEPDGDLVCQTCEVDGTNCDPPTVEKGSNGILSGERLQEPSRDLGRGGELREPSRDLRPQLLQKDGMVLNLPTENKTAPLNRTVALLTILYQGISLRNREKSKFRI